MHLAEDHIPHPLHRVTLNFPKILTGEEAQEIADLVDDIAVSVFLHNRESTDGDDWTVGLTTYGMPDIAEILSLLDGRLDAKDIHIEKLPEKDWLRHVHENFPPVQTGKFFVYGSHYDGLPPAELIALKIDAATAFGSGEHETTKGCLMAFEGLAKDHTFKNALDMGCGSGILGIGMEKLWSGIRVTAIDIDHESVIVTKRHAEMNNVRNLVAEEGDGYNAPLAQKNAPYDIVAANILAGPLIDMASQLAAALSPGGFAILSGLLARQEKDVIAAQEAQGLKMIRSIALGDWRALVLQKN